MKKRKKAKNVRELRENYVLYLELGMIATLVLFLIAFKVDYRPDPNERIVTEKQETVKMEDVIQTKQEKEPPPPPRPQVPMEVPNDEIVEEGTIDINADFDMNKKMSIPEPPREPAKEEDDEEIFVIVEQPPQLIGGLAALQQKIQYPEMARKAGIEGRVFVQFVVNHKGDVENPVITRGIGGGCDQEALRVIKEAKFKPGMQRGRTVKVRYSMPIVFRLTQAHNG